MKWLRRRLRRCDYCWRRHHVSFWDGGETIEHLCKKHDFVTGKKDK